MDATPSAIALVMNATASQIVQVTVSCQDPVAATVPGMPLFPVPPATGSTAIAGCSVPIPVNTPFTLAVHFDTGEVARISTSNDSVATPAMYIVAFLNGLVATRPGGRARCIQFVNGLHCDFDSGEPR